MQRITVTIDDDLLESLDAIALARGYATRSEAVRDLVRRGALELAAADDTAHCTAILGYVCDPAICVLPQRLTNACQAHGVVTIASMKVHLADNSALEVAVTHGAPAHVRRVVGKITAQRGVSYAALHLVPSVATDPRLHLGADAEAEMSTIEGNAVPSITEQNA